MEYSQKLLANLLGQPQIYFYSLKIFSSPVLALLGHDFFFFFFFYNQSFFYKQIQFLAGLHLRKELDSCVNMFLKFLKKHLRYWLVDNFSFCTFLSFTFTEATLANSEKLFNSFLPNAPFLYPMKTSENRKDFTLVQEKWVFAAINLI